MIEIEKGTFINPNLIAVIKSVGDGKCALFTAGQSAADGGFLVDYDADELAEEIEKAIEES